MTSVLSKRQQARNEKQLQDLVQSVGGNNKCADCHARNPAWASWNLGVFLCLRCAAIHRKLGTHISKVKSLSMDSWSNEQVENMRKVGNVASNQIYNPENRRPPVPIDADEADSAMEKFIRQKYIHTASTQSGKLDSPRSEEGTPPPLPPKNSSKFAFRSASSLFPLSSRARREAKQVGLQTPDGQASLTLNNKPSKVFGATVDYDAPGDNDKKLERLRDMGFHDGQRNAIVLKGVNGNIDRAVEALVRLGEGERPLPPAPREHKLRPSRSFTPSAPSSSNFGASVEDRRQPEQNRPTTSSAVSTNPFDSMTRSQPLTAHSTGSLSMNNPYDQVSTNPFASLSQQPDQLQQAFQDMNINGQQNMAWHTGGTIATQGLQPQPFYQQSTPSTPQHPQGFGLSNSMTYPIPSQYPSQMQQQPTGYNPYYSHPSSPILQTNILQFPAYNPQQSPGPFVANPYLRSPTRMASSPSLGQIPEQTQPTALTASPLPLASPQTNPFFANSTPAAQNFQSFTQQSQYNQQPRHDKASIMALYNLSPVGQQGASAFTPNLHTQNNTIPENQAVQVVNQPTEQAQPTAYQSRSASQPLPGTNPYTANGPFASPTDPFGGPRQISRESMNLGMDMAWATNGRHSPDAFASLSARHV